MPDTIGRYLVEGPLGAGGMGEVLRGRDPDLDRPLAIKLLHPQRSLDEAHRARLIREAQALAALAHPNIVNVFEVGIHREQVYVAMELVEGLPLHTWTRERARGWEDVVRMYVQAGRGLHAAHVRGLVHRDFKPSNVLVGDDGRARVLDFGLATLDGSAEVLRSKGASGSGSSPSFDVFTEDLTADGTVVGTPAYMALEQHTRDPVTAATDQFGFCVALWEALAGERPYAGSDLATVRASLHNGRLEPVPKGVEAPRRIFELLARGLAIAPDARWPSLEVLLDRLEASLRPRRRWPWVLVAAGLAGVLAVVLAPGPPSPCEAADEASPWGATDRDVLEQAFEGSGMPEVRQVWPEVRQAFDDHAAAWADGHARVCRSEVADANGQRIFDLRMGCLQQQRDSVRVVLDVLVHGEASTLVHASEAVARLRPVEACLEALEGDPATALPADPAVAKVASELRAQLVGAEALTVSGRLDEAEAQARLALEGATGLGFEPARVEAELRLGIVLSRLGRPHDAEPLLSRAYWGASDLDYPKVGAEAAIELAWQVGYLQGRHDDGIEWARHYESMARRAGQEPAKHVALVLGPIYFDAGMLEQARPYLELQLAEALAEGDARMVAIARMNLANLLHELGEDERAAEEFRVAQTELERLFPEGHPELALAMINRADLTMESNLPITEALLQRGVAMSIATNGEDHPATGLGLAKLGGLHREQGRAEEAVAVLERAVRAYAAGAPVERLQAEHALADALREVGRVQEAEARWRAVLDAAETELGAEHELAGRARVGLGRLAQDRGEIEVARREYEAVIEKVDERSEVRAEARRALAELP
jgi:tetratricopeptide (TPR) repeat protein